MMHLFNYKIDYKKFLFILIFAIVLFLWLISLFNSHKLALENKKLLENVNFLEQKFTTSKNKYEEEIARQDAIITKSTKYANSLIEEITWINKIKPKNINVVVKEKVLTEIDTQFVYLQDTSGNIDSNYIRVPNSFYNSTPYFTIKGQVLKNKIHFDKISFTNTITTVLVKERHNLFYNKQVVYVHMDNPHSSIKDLKSVVVKKEPKKFINRTVNAVLFTAGFFIGTRI